MHSMQMAARHVGHVTILDLVGTITCDAGAPRLRESVHDLLREQRTAVLLNLAEISYIDSAGLGELAASHAVLAEAGGGLKLLHVNARNQHLLSITRLNLIFQTFDVEDEALRSFAALLVVPPSLVSS